jgi:putative glycosyltransferase (TIGR04372 family)
MAFLARMKGFLQRRLPRCLQALRSIRRQQRLWRAGRYLLAGQRRLACGDVARTRACAQQALETSRFDPGVFRVLLLWTEKQSLTSQTLLERLGPWLERTSCGPEYAEVFDHLRTLDSDCPVLRLCLARNAWLCGQVERMIPTLKPVVLAGSSDPDVWDLLEKAALVTESNDHLVWELLGHKAVQKNDPEIAWQHYEKALGLKPTLSHVVQALELTLALLGRPQEVASLPGRGHEEDSQFYLGLAYHNAGNSERACSAWLRYLEMVGEDNPSILLSSGLAGATLEEERPVRSGAIPVTAFLVSSIRSAVSIFWQILGHHAFQHNDLALARRRYERGLAVTPDSDCLKSALGITLLMEERLEEAIPLLEHCSRQEPVSGDTLLYLGLAYAARGETEPARAAWERQLELLGDDCDRLSFHFVTLHMGGAFELAQKCESRHQQIQAQRRRSGALARPIFLTWWTRAIGHLAYLDAWVKARELTEEIDEWPTIRTRSDMIGNRCYLSCWSKFFEIEEVDDPGIEGDEREVLYPSSLKVPGLDRCPYHLAVGAIQRNWEAQGRGPLLKLPDSVRRCGHEQLKRLGLSAGQPFVTLHIREPGFKKWDVGFRHRNAHLASYLPAIRALLRQGVQVIRLGAPHGEPAPALDGFSDYSHTDFRADWMDVFLCAEGLFHIGVESGISHIPMTFGRPTLFTNWMRWGTLPWYGGDLVMPKLFRNEKTGGLVPLAEIIGSAQEHPQYSFFLSARGLTPVPNAPEDIRDAALEMLQRAQGKMSVPEPDDEWLQNTVRNLLRDRGQVMNCRLASSYLQRNRHVLTGRRALRDSA